MNMLKNTINGGGSSNRARVKFKTNEIENVKTFATDDSEEEENESDDSEMVEKNESDGLEMMEENESDDSEMMEKNESNDSEMVEENESDGSEIMEENESDGSEMVEENESDGSEIVEENKSDGSEIMEDASESMNDAVSNAGWADVMRKILQTNRPKGKKTIVLAKAKKLCDVKKEEEDKSYEIIGVQGEKTDSEKTSVKTEHTEYTAQAKPRREKNVGIRVKPSITDRERERMLQKIATKGVVQLFNAVRQQQVEIRKKMSQAGPLERKREQVLKNIDKNAFLDILMGSSKSIPVDNPVKSDETVEENTIQNNNSKDNKNWNVLRDDFVMGAKLKDWDKKDAEEEDSSAPENMDSD